jgi:cytochrome P450
VSTAAITDPDTYTEGVPYELLASLRRESPVVRVDDFWAVLGHSDVRYVLRNPRLFSSQLGGTQIRDRPAPGPGGVMPDPRARAGMPDLYAYATALGEYKRRNPGDDVMSNLMGHVDDDDDGGRVSIAEFENLFWLFSVAGNETLRNGIPGGMLALLSHPDQYRRLLTDRARSGAGLAGRGRTRR